MRGPIISTLVVAAAVLLAAKEAFPAGPPEPGDQAPEIKVDDWLNTKPLTLAKLRGKIVIVEFWATWCPPCRKSIPHLIKLHEMYKDKGVVLMSLTNEPIDKIRSFVKEYKMTYAVGAGSKTSRDYGVRGIPHAYIVDPNGKVAWHGHPMAGMDEKIERALRETPPSLLSPEELARAKKNIELAQKALDSGRFARTSALLVALRRMDLPADLENTLGELSEELGVFASDALEELMGLVEAEKPLEAIRACKKLARDFVGTSAAAEAKELRAALSNDPETKKLIRGREAATALASADALLSAKQYVKAKAEFEQVAATFGGTPGAEKAEARLREMASDPEIRDSIDSAKAGRQIRSWLSMARNWARAGDKAKALDYYRKLIDTYPDLPAADTARKEAEELQ